MGYVEVRRAIIGPKENRFGKTLGKAIAVSLDDKWLASTTDDGFVDLWSISGSFQLSSKLTHSESFRMSSDEITSLGFSRDSQYLVTEGTMGGIGRLSVWKLDRRSPMDKLTANDEYDHMSMQELFAIGCRNVEAYLTDMTENVGMREKNDSYDYAQLLQGCRIAPPQHLIGYKKSFPAATSTSAGRSIQVCFRRAVDVLT